MITQFKATDADASGLFADPSGMHCGQACKQQTHVDIRLETVPLRLPVRAVAADNRRREDE